MSYYHTLMKSFDFNQEHGENTLFFYHLSEFQDDENTPIRTLT